MTKTLATLKAWFVCALAIGLSLVIGYALAHFIGILPASLWGMLAFAAMLTTPWLNAELVEGPINKAMAYMPLVFIPICVGVIEYGDVLANAGWQILLAGATSTLLSLFLVSKVAAFFLQREDKHG